MENWAKVAFMVGPMVGFALAAGVWGAVDLAQNWDNPCHTYGDKDNPSTLQPTPECPTVSSQGTTRGEEIWIMLGVHGGPIILGAIAVCGGYAKRPLQVGLTAIPLLAGPWFLFLSFIGLLWWATAAGLIVISVKMAKTTGGHATKN